MNGWKTLALAEITEVAAGGGAPQDSTAFSSDGHPFVRAGSLNSLVDGASEQTLEHIKPEVAEAYGLRLFPANTVVFAKSGMSATRGLIHRLRIPCYVVNHLAALIPTEKIEPRYLEHCLKSQSPTRLVQDAAYPSIRLTDIADMRIPAPQKSEQQRIAAILDQAEALRANRRLALDKLVTLTHSLFIDLFGDGANPHNWPVTGLGEFVNFTTGKLDSNAAVSNGAYPFFTCSREDFRIDHYAFDCEALLLAGNNATADYSVKHYKGKFNAYQRTYVITLKNAEHSYAYARIVLERKLSEMKRFSKGSNTKYLTLGILKDIRIQVPPIALQRDFERRATVLENLESVQQASLVKLDSLFASLQHRAFRGEL